MPGMNLAQVLTAGRVFGSASEQMLTFGVSLLTAGVKFKNSYFFLRFWPFAATKRSYFLRFKDFSPLLAG